MSDLKFNCPSCGQHVQCDIDHAGENIPCPSCAQLIRVPAWGSVVNAKPQATENPFAADESKVSYTTTKEEAKKPDSNAAPTLEENIAGKTKAGPPVTHREEELAAARQEHKAQPTSQVKPRLSFILSGGQAPPREENDAALTPEQKKLMTPKKPHPDIDSFSE
jgi:ribosomal protein S27E